jgi:HD-GYP domain-containing protein (c-di-GMP phosphodiesterase class II)
VNPEVEQLRPRLKEILYDCAVEVRATKAALYLFDGIGRFDLVAEYGFRGVAREWLDRNQPVVDRCGRGRSPYFINGIAAEPRFSEYLYEASTDRLLAAPIYSRGELVGLIDMRDKQGRLPFDTTDLGKAQQIAERMMSLFSTKNVFRQSFVTLSEPTPIEAPHVVWPHAPAAPTPPPTPPPARAPVRPPAAPAPAPAAAPAVVPPPASRLAALTAQARAAVEHLAVLPPMRELVEADLAAARGVLRSILLVPGANVAMLSAFGQLDGVQELVARSALHEEAKSLIQSKLTSWLSKRGEAGGFTRSALHTPFGTSEPMITRAQIARVFTAPVAVDAMRGLYLTVAFSTAPDRAAHELLAALLSALQTAIEHSIAAGALTTMHARAAETILEPDQQRYPELRRHTTLVVSRTDAFARHLRLTPREAETARLTAMVHDVGLRLLDYERLYRRRDLAPDDVALLREHVSVGASLVEPLLGSEVARAVLCHHEQPDGRGYPHQLRGEDIPLASRIVQICDAWVAMTDPESYRRPFALDAALNEIRAGAGKQFDAELAAAFADLMR